MKKEIEIQGGSIVYAVDEPYDFVDSKTNQRKQGVSNFMEIFKGKKKAKIPAWVLPVLISRVEDPEFSALVKKGGNGQG